jgi:hypothetical protein
MKRNVPNTYRLLTALSALLTVVFLITVFSFQATAQDQDQDQDDPPSRVARLGYMEGSVSFQPSGESEWVEAVANRPMTTGDKLWADQNSRAEVQLGSASIDLAPNTGFSFLNLDDNTVQIQLSSGILNVRVRELDRDDVFEIDTPNQAFTISQPGSYRVEASEDGTYTVVTIRDGAGESTGNGQSYTLHAGQRTTFSGTTSLNAEVQQIGPPDGFDQWAEARYQRYDNSPSLRYCSREMVGYADLDDNGDWQPDPNYGNVWFPRVAVGWAPYHDGHWAWIDPWGWTWVDDARWGYAPFHYGRWASIRGRWGWIPGPREVRPVYAPALVAFVGGVGIGVGGNVAWFPLGPREVYVPSYRVSRGYVDRVNVSNTTVNVTQVTNVYNTTIINKTTTITNVTYVNRNVRGGITAVPQRAFASAQPVARAAVAVDVREMSAGPISSRAAVPPVREAVLGAHANTANRVAAPPQAIANRQVIAKAAPPPPAASFAAREQVLARNPGQPVPRQEMQRLRPANAPAQVMVKRAPPSKPATATPAPASNARQPMSRPGNPPAGNERPGANPVPGRPEPGGQPAANQPAPNRPPANQPAGNQPTPNRMEPNRPQPSQPTPGRPEPNRPETNRPPTAQPNNRPEPNRPEPTRPNDNRPQPNQPMPRNAAPDNRPQPNRPQPNRPETNRPTEPTRNQPAPRTPTPPPNDRPQTRTPPPAETRPAPPKQAQPGRPQAPDEKKRQDEQKKNDQRKDDQRKNDEKPKPPQ